MVSDLYNGRFEFLHQTGQLLKKIYNSTNFDISSDCNSN